MNSSNALSSVGVMGYTLQGMASGVLGLSSMAWSQGRDGGNRWEASSLKSRLKCSYTAGILTSFLPSPAWMANSVAILLMVVVSVSSCTMSSFSLLVFSPAMTVRESTGCVDDMMMGRALVSIMASFHPNVGSNVASHGYPRRRSSLPMSVTRNHITLSIPLVVTLSSRE